MGSEDCVVEEINFNVLEKSDEIQRYIKEETSDVSDKLQERDGSLNYQKNL